MYLHFTTNMTSTKLSTVTTSGETKNLMIGMPSHTSTRSSLTICLTHMTTTLSISTFIQSIILCTTVLFINHVTLQHMDAIEGPVEHQHTSQLDTLLVPTVIQHLADTPVMAT